MMTEREKGIVIGTGIERETETVTERGREIERGRESVTEGTGTEMKENIAHRREKTVAIQDTRATRPGIEEQCR